MNRTKNVTNRGVPGNSLMQRKRERRLSKVSGFERVHLEKNSFSLMI